MKKTKSTRKTQPAPTGDQIAVPTTTNALTEAKEATLTALEQERIQRWKSKKATEESSVVFKQGKVNTDTLTHVEMDYVNEDLSYEQKRDVHYSIMYGTTGSTSVEFAHQLVSETLTAMFKRSSQDIECTTKAMSDALLALNPTDTYEGMLCSRLLVLHNQYMHFMALSASPTQTTKGVDLNINRATKLMRLYNETFDALNKYRRKGEQKFVVQHVNVQSGGQAVVGDVHNGGGVYAKE